MAGLLVSVRSAEEARAAVAGGASVIDVKEPDLGPLGRAPAPAIRAIRSAVPAAIPVSMALGELGEWRLDRAHGEGIAFRKLGLAGSGPDWEAAWAEIRGSDPDGPRWVAVAYSDWEIARSPRPDRILEAALDAPEVVGVLVDTWDKSRPGSLDASPGWIAWAERARSGGRFVALAGRLDLAAIARLAPLQPDLFAVRGAACVGGDRRGVVDARRVAELARAVGGTVSRSPYPFK
ncbi:(5-formylfuran-3-yl)methyl phosphate synthase [Tundrisphaera sp. TA3]|uniref:(5-formylfuran-3-yl)methyl phosphate synthase n=1 Tax=Tundrisphaera sp. TA3 TaxID=3435775 RepID=UPI003EBC9AA1